MLYGVISCRFLPLSAITLGAAAMYPRALLITNIPASGSTPLPLENVYQFLQSLKGRLDQARSTCPSSSCRCSSLREFPEDRDAR